MRTCTPTKKCNVIFFVSLSPLVFTWFPDLFDYARRSLKVARASRSHTMYIIASKRNRIKRKTELTIRCEWGRGGKRDRGAELQKNEQFPSSRELSKVIRSDDDSWWCSCSFCRRASHIISIKVNFLPNERLGIDRGEQKETLAARPARRKDIIASGTERPRNRSFRAIAEKCGKK